MNGYELRQCLVVKHTPYSKQAAVSVVDLSQTPPEVSSRTVSVPNRTDNWLEAVVVRDGSFYVSTATQSGEWQLRKAHCKNGHFQGFGEPVMSFLSTSKAVKSRAGYGSALHFLGAANKSEPKVGGFTSGSSNKVYYWAGSEGGVQSVEIESLIAGSNIEIGNVLQATQNSFHASFNTQTRRFSIQFMKSPLGERELEIIEFDVGEKPNPKITTIPNGIGAYEVNGRRIVLGVSNGVLSTAEMPPSMDKGELVFKPVLFE